MSSILQRIKQIADKEDLKITYLEIKIGASKGVLSRAIKNNTDIQSKWITRIIENYPQYDAAWLLTGQGNILKEKIDNTIDETLLAKDKIISLQDQLIQQLQKRNEELEKYSLKLKKE